MTIPLDRLYHFIDKQAQEILGDRVVIYRFWPHGSKNINDLNRLYDYTWKEHTSSISIWCNDQEPLDHDYYSKNLRGREMTEWDRRWDKLVASVEYKPAEPKNLNWCRNWFEKNILLHSELRSNNLYKYQQEENLVTVYYWNHGLLSLDWFRYAKHEHFQKNTQKLFLIYNRAWSGTREYRLKMADLLIEHDLLDHCQTKFNAIDPGSGLHYRDYEFVNRSWTPTNILENYFEQNLTRAESSADFCTKDYDTTDIEVVLETLFDDDRLHLTEKSCRPLACCQPFIIAGTHGSLAYLRKYGFKTWHEIWDESYDLEEDSQQRLHKIIKVMNDIAGWDRDTRNTKMKQAREIAKFNQQHFFSKNFFDCLINELKNNLTTAFNTIKMGNNYAPWINLWTKILSDKDMLRILKQRNDPILPNFESVNHMIIVAKEKLGLKQ